MPNCKFMEDVNKRRRISVSLYNALFKKSPPGKFANICHFQQIGINVTVFEKHKFFLKVTFSLPLPSSMLKLPNVGRAVQTDPTLLRNPSESTESKKCWALLVLKFDQFQNFAQQLPTTRKQQETNARWMIQRCCVRVARGFGIIHSLLDFVLPDFVLFWICKHRRH